MNIYRVWNKVALNTYDHSHIFILQVHDWNTRKQVYKKVQNVDNFQQKY